MATDRSRPGAYAGPDRRKAPRGRDDPSDWESRALRRVAGRVKSLDDDGFGWERAVLELLRKRLDDGA